MNISKSNIIKNIAKKLSLPSEDGAKILESFLLLIKTNTKLKKVKLSGFGSFLFKTTPKRIGRNPKTQDSYIIPKLNKLNFKPSNKLKNNLN